MFKHSSEMLCTKFRCQLIEFRSGFIMCLTDHTKNETSFWKYCIIIWMYFNHDGHVCLCASFYFCLYIMCILYIWTLSLSKKNKKGIYIILLFIVLYYTMLYYSILYIIIHIYILKQNVDGC